MDAEMILRNLEAMAQADETLREAIKLAKSTSVGWFQFGNMVRLVDVIFDIPETDKIQYTGVETVRTEGSRGEGESRVYTERCGFWVDEQEYLLVRTYTVSPEFITVIQIFTVRHSMGSVFEDEVFAWTGPGKGRLNRRETELPIIIDGKYLTENVFKKDAKT